MIDPISFLFRDFMSLRATQLDIQSKHPLRIQRFLLTKLVLRARNTRFGKQHKFSRITSIKSFQKNVPVSHYIDFKSDIEDMMNGTPNVLWPGKVHYFTKSSATTSDSKYIPVSKSSLVNCHFKGGKDMIALYLLSNPQTRFFSGKVLSLCGSLHPYPENPKIEVGDISAILTKHLPIYAQLFRFPGPELALKNGWEHKIEEISDLALNENITGLVGAPVWILSFIKKVLEKSGKRTIHEVWPNLEVFMHGGISFKPYRAVFDELFEGHDVKYIESYNASEGYFAIQDDLIKPNEMRLMLDYGVFYEFIPVELYEKGIYTTVYTVKDVSLSVPYVIVITTNGGLWRYVIGDTVVFTSLDPLRIKITGRTKQFLNLYDEEVTMDNVEHAIAFACEKTDAKVEDFSMCASIPDNDGRGFHEWAIEFSSQPKDINLFSKYIDEALIKENGDYADRRINNIVLQSPVIHVLPSKTFYKWMKSKNKLGGQFKVPRVSNSREHVESLVNFVD